MPRFKGRKATKREMGKGGQARAKARGVSVPLENFAGRGHKRGGKRRHSRY